MIVRDALVMALGAGAVVIALWTCTVQARNHECARELARAQRRWEMLEAANAQARARLAAHVPGVAPEDLDVTERAVSQRLREEARP